MRLFIENLRLSLGSLAANPLRSLLTLVGIVIGVATVVTMMALTEGLRLKVNRDLTMLGANVFRVDKWPGGIHIGGERLNWSKIAQRPPLTLAELRAIRDGCPAVSQVAAAAFEGGQKVSTAAEETQPSVFIQGVTAEYVETSGLSLSAGRFVSEGDDIDARPVAVIGPDVADKLFPGIDPLGQEIRLKGRPFRVVGVMARRGKLLGLMSLDNMALLPLGAFSSIYGSKRSLSLHVQASEGKFEQAQEEVTRLLRQKRKVPPNEPNNFEISTNESMSRTLNNLTQVVMAATFGVCLLSLLVGGIGILNIMLVAVTERTREIGIRKALGARRKTILAQFATEAVTLSLLGGVLGIATGFGLAGLGRWALGLPTEVPAWAVALSIGMSSTVGLVFGIYPAAKAAALDPVEAMRAE